MNFATLSRRGVVLRPVPPFICIKSPRRMEGKEERERSSNALSLNLPAVTKLRLFTLVIHLERFCLNCSALFTFLIPPYAQWVIARARGIKSSRLLWQNSESSRFVERVFTWIVLGLILFLALLSYSCSTLRSQCYAITTCGDMFCGLVNSHAFLFMAEPWRILPQLMASFDIISITVRLPYLTSLTSSHLAISLE